MRSTNRKLLLTLYRTLDTLIALFVLFGLFVASNHYRMPNGMTEFLAIRVTVKNLLLLGFFSLAWAYLCHSFGLYNSQRLMAPRDEIIRVIKVCSLGSLLVFLFPLTSVSGSFRLVTVFYFWIATLLYTVLARFLIHGLMAYLRLHGRNLRRLIIVGSGRRALELYQYITSKPATGYHVLGFVDSLSLHHPVSPEIASRRLGTLEQLEEILMHRVVDEVIITLPIKSCYHEIQKSIQTCETMGIQSKYLSDLFLTSVAKMRHDHTEHFPVVTLHVATDDYRLIVKRALDIVVASLGLILLSPMLLLISTVIKLTSQVPIIFAQERYGLNKRRFRMYKFRTMVTNADDLQHMLEHKNEADGPVFKIKNDPRVTPIGKFLRKTSLDELPQLFNVLKGDMSLVGPRPLPLRDVSRFSEGWLMRRFSVKPGLTCLWQINGRSNASFDQWIEQDLEYIDNWSLGLDFEILAKTVPAVIRGSGAT